MEELKDKLPYNCLVVGGTNSGKSKYIVDLLRGPYRLQFEYVVLICSTLSKNDTYRGFGNNDPIFIVIQPDGSNLDEINNILSYCKELFSGFETLLILDDCAFSKDLKQRSSAFIDLAFSARHHRISVWVLTQQLTAIAKSFRENVACIVSFHNCNKTSTQILFDDYGSDLDVEHKKEYMKLLKSEHYSHICFCLRHPYQSYIEIPNVII